MEHVKNIPKIKHLGIDDDAQMAINCEWVGAGFAVLPSGC
jgi:hexokinase